jgi:hypothetical protein
MSDRLHAREAQLEELLDGNEIRAVLARYCRGIDRLDRELIASVYHPDARDSHGSFVGLAGDFVNWVTTVALPKYSWTMHNLGTCSIELHGDLAYSETYAICYHGLPLAPGKERLITVAVRYLDRFERRRAGAWLIADRVVAFEWQLEQEIDAIASLRPEVTQGRRDRRDPSYHS